MNSPTKTLSVQELQLHNFRNHSSLNLQLLPSPVIITGLNGAGKTNILEAISLLSPGRGVRNARLDELGKIKEQQKENWRIKAIINGYYGNQEILTLSLPSIKHDKRIINIDDIAAKTQGELAQIFSVSWLTPQMDQLFIGSSANRRKFLDRIVYNFFHDHANNLIVYEKLMRERARLLKSFCNDTYWLNSLEFKMAESAKLIIEARIKTIEILQATIQESYGLFPKATIEIAGELEELIKSSPEFPIEEYFRKKLFECRVLDTKTNRTNIGPHKSDLLTYYEDQHLEAKNCSTGEQKALLLSIILAKAKASKQKQNILPVLLLDEVIAHLDPQRREALFEEIINLGAQVWMTGTDEELFESLRDKAQFFNI